MVGVGMSDEQPTVLRHADGVTRCWWATQAGEDLRQFHDQEWGTPTRQPAAMFEALVR